MGGLEKTVTKLVLVFMTLLGGQLIFGTPVFGVTAPSISISLGSSLALSLDPGVLGTTSQTISITTNNYTGYTATLTNSTNATDLVNSSNNSLVIPTITLPQGSSTITTSQFSSGYGLSTDGTNYRPAPTSSASLSLGSRNTAGTTSHTLYLAVLPDIGTASGTYTKAYVVSAVVNNPEYSITFNANAGTDTVSDMPTNISTTTSSTGTITLPNTVPTRSNYTFLGWDTNSSATTPTYPKNNTNTIDLEPTQANGIVLYAIWQSSGGGSGTWTDPIEDTTTNTYDPNNVPANSTIVYEGITGHPQVSTDEDGNITRFEYTDTSSSNPLALNSEFDTGVLAFDGGGFTISLTGSFPWTANTIAPVISLSGLINGSASGLNVNISKNNQFYTKTDGSQVGTTTTIDRIRCFQYSGGTLSNTYNLLYSNDPTANISATNQKTLGWAQADAPFVGTIIVTGTPNGSNMEIDVKAYKYNTSNDTDTLIGILQSRYKYSISGLQSSGITVELGYYQRNTSTSYSYAFSIYKFSVIKN
ncbi:InlB B-repeat-containing protein [Candidatus Saccharibacteria bacterium]|nr:InlB B-repeat-containing protein [Candidatus Saccharibacteria bacterium]